MRVHTGGPAQVGQTLTASPSCIADANGLTKWLANDTEIDGPTSSTYTLQASVNGKVITVRVAFTDDGWRLQNELGWHHDRGNLLRRAEGIALLEERRWCGCLLRLHQRNQDPGSEWRRSLAGQRALRCVQRCSGPHPFLLTPPSHSAPLINYGEPEANITSAVRDFLVLTGLVKPGDVVEENPPGLTPHSQTTPSLSASFMYWYAG